MTLAAKLLERDPASSAPGKPAATGNVVGEAGTEDVRDVTVSAVSAPTHLVRVLTGREAG